LNQLHPPDESVPSNKAEPKSTSWQNYTPELGAFLAAVLGRLPAMGAWWTLDDWGQLARSAGLDTGEVLPALSARWLSQHLYWDLTWPVFGLNSDAHAIVRLLLHGLAAVLVVRLAKRGGLSSLPSLIAGLIFAASPMAFTPLYWASGVQELLAAVFALAAVDRWLAAGEIGRRGLVWATIFSLLSMLSKESGLGLPLLFLALAWARAGLRLEDKAFAWAMIMCQLAGAVVAGTLVLEHFATAPGEAYSLGGALLMVSNLFTFGWWLMSPWPILTSHVSLPMSMAGGLLFLAWGVWGVVLARRNQGLVLFALFAALLVLAPSLPLQRRLVPYLGYLAVAPVALLLASIWQALARGSKFTPDLSPVAVSLLALATAAGFWGMQLRASHRTELDLLADPVVRATAVSWDACQAFRQLQQPRDVPGVATAELTHLTLLQPLVDPTSSALAREMGERWTQPTDLFESLSGTRGPRLILGPEVQVNWANGLTTASSKAMVLCETATGIRYWGPLGNALLYAALTEVGLGHFVRARAHMNRAAELGGDQIMFIFDEGQMVIPMAMVLQQKEAFTDWTLGLIKQGTSRMEVAGLQDQFYNVLSAASGRSVADLTAGSRLIAAPPAPPVPTAPSAEKE